MKPSTILTLCLFLSFLSHAQSNQQIVFDLKDVAPKEKVSIPFSAIKVIDARFDKTNIGVFTTDFTRPFNKQKKQEVSFPDSLKTYLPLAIEKIGVLDRSKNDTLVLLIKRFRLADRFRDEIADAYNPELFLNISLSFYELKDNDYHKILSVDDIQTSVMGKEAIVSNSDAERLRKESFLEILSNLFDNKNWQSSAIAFNYSDIQLGLDKRFDLPVLRDTLHVSGLYKSFDEFKNNKPSLSNVKFTIKKGIHDKVLDSNNVSINLKNYWGASIDNQPYILFRGMFCKLIKSDNGFKFKSYRTSTDINGGSLEHYGRGTGTGLDLILIGANAFNKLSESKIRTEFFYLNMESGKVHLEEIFGRASLTSKDLMN